MVNKHKGFTIVETMIAVGTFSLIAIIATIVAVQLSRSYQLGITKATLDTTARKINTEFSQAVILTSSSISSQSGTLLSASSPSTDIWQYWCLGTNRFSWVEPPTLSTIPSYGLYLDHPNTCTTTTALSLDSVTTKNLTPSGVFVSKFQVTDSGSLHRLQLVLGDGSSSMFVNNDVTTNLLTSKFPSCLSQSLGNYSFCAVVYYDNSVETVLK